MADKTDESRSLLVVARSFREFKDWIKGSSVPVFRPGVIYVSSRDAMRGRFQDWIYVLSMPDWLTQDELDFEIAVGQLIAVTS